MQWKIGPFLLWKQNLSRQSRGHRDAVVRPDPHHHHGAADAQETGNKDTIYSFLSSTFLLHMNSNQSSFISFHLIFQVNSVRFSFDGTRVASVGSDFYMKVIDLKTGSILFSKGSFFSVRVTCLCLICLPQADKNRMNIRAKRVEAQIRVWLYFYVLLFLIMQV